MSLGFRHEIGLENDNDIQSKSEFFIVELTLEYVFAQVVFDGGFFEVFCIHLVEIDFCAILGFPAEAAVFSFKRCI